MCITLVFFGAVVFFFLLVFWPHDCQRHTAEMPSNPPAVLLVRPSSVTESANSDVDNGVTVIRLSRNTLVSSPHSQVVNKLVLVDLRVVEYDFAKRERVEVTRRFNGALMNRNPPGQADRMY